MIYNYVCPFTSAYMCVCFGLTSCNCTTYKRTGSRRKLISLLLAEDLHLGRNIVKFSPFACLI